MYYNVKFINPYNKIVELTLNTREIELLKPQIKIIEISEKNP